MSIEDPNHQMNLGRDAFSDANFMDELKYFSDKYPVFAFSDQRMAQILRQAYVKDGQYVDQVILFPMSGDNVGRAYAWTFPVGVTVAGIYFLGDELIAETDTASRYSIPWNRANPSGTVSAGIIASKHLLQVRDTRSLGP